MLFRSLICDSYFDADFGSGYDCAISTYSLHHFSEADKLKLYQKTRAALEPGSLFVLGDYTVDTMERQQALIAENDRLRGENGIADRAFYHFDTPFTAEVEINLLKSAGFIDAKCVRQWESTSIITARA